MGVFTRAAQAPRSRPAKAVIGGIALLSASALTLAGCAGTNTPSEPTGPAVDLTYKIGEALPVTGSLAFLGPPEIAAVAYAADVINKADKGITIELTEGDSGDTDNKAYETEIPRLLNAGVTAIIGAASSGTSLKFIDQVIGAGVIQFSPANTSDAFTTYKDNGLYWRTAPSDVLQGAVLGNWIADSGVKNLAFITLNDAYGLNLEKYVTEAFTAAGGTVVAHPTYNTGDTNFSAQIAEIDAAKPDAIAILAFDEFKTIVPELITAGFTADQFWGVDGNIANYGDAFPTGTLKGMRSTAPGLSIDTLKDFTDALNAFWTGEGKPALKDYSYAAESYDAVVLLALAALEANSTVGADVAAKLQEVSGGTGGGTKCTSFEDCADVILGGGTADYEGISGPITFDEVGDPTEATISYYIYGDDNNYSAFTE